MLTLINKTDHTPRTGDHVWLDADGETYIITGIPDKNYTPPDGYPNAIWRGRLRDDNFADVHIIMWRDAKAGRFTSFPDDDEDE